MQLNVIDTEWSGEGLNPMWCLMWCQCNSLILWKFKIFQVTNLRKKKKFYWHFLYKIKNRNWKLLDQSRLHFCYSPISNTIKFLWHIFLMVCLNCYLKNFNCQNVHWRGTFFCGRFFFILYRHCCLTQPAYTYFCDKKFWQ